MSRNEANEQQVMALRNANRLTYYPPHYSSLIQRRTTKSYNFSNALYSPGSVAQCIINSGNDALWGPNGYLRIALTKDAAKNFSSNGNVLSIFENARLTHRSGEVLEYIQDVNILANIRRQYEVDNDDAEKLNGFLKVANSKTACVYIVPLWLILGVFNVSTTYIPPGFLAGAKLELKLATTDIAMVDGAYSNVSMTINLESSQIYDPALKQIMDQESDVDASGLQFNYSTWFGSNNATNATAINFDIQLAASITEKAIGVVRRNDYLVADKDSFAFVPLVRSQYRLAESYMPQQALELGVGVAPASTSGVEAYHHSLVAFDASPNQFLGHKSSGGCSVKLNEWASVDADAAAAPDAAGGPSSAGPVYAQTLELSSTGIAYTGEKTNNARQLRWEATRASADAGRVDVFLQYVRVANIMGSNLRVDR